MANREGTSSPEAHCVLLETSLDTRLVTLVHNDESISEFKNKFCKEHKECFPKVGEINITALKVKRRGFFYHLSDSMIMSKVFNDTTKNWFVYADVVSIEKCELPTIMAADQNCSNPELLEKKKEAAIDTVTIYQHTKDLTCEKALETEVAKKQSRKRKIKNSDTKESRKKSKVDLNQSAVATNTSVCAVDESQELCGKLQVEAVPNESSPREKLDDILIGATGKDVDCGEKKNGVSMAENQQSSDAGRLGQEKTTKINSEVVTGHTMDEAKDVQANQTPKEALREKLHDLTGAIEQDLEKGEKAADLVKINQDKDLASTLERADGHITSKDDDAEKLDVFISEAIEKDNERGEGSRLATSGSDNIQTDNFVSSEKQLEASSGLTTEKKKRRRKSLKDNINQSPAAVTSTSRDIVNNLNGVPANVDSVDATSESCLNSRKETLGNPLAEAMQKENDIGEESVVDVGKDNIETDNLACDPASQVEANNGLTNVPATEKKRSRKKSSKDHINESPAAVTSTSRDTVNDINRVPGRESLINPLAEAMQKENEMGEKIDKDVGSGKAIQSASDNVQTGKFVGYPENQVVVSSGLTTGPATEKKRARKKSSKDHTNQSTGAASTTSREIVTERDTVSGSIACVDATSESFPNENEMGDKLVDNVGSKEATFVGADNLQAANNQQAANLASTPHGLVKEYKTLDTNGKLVKENRTCEHEASKDNNVEMDVDEAKSVKSTKKKKSKKAKTPAIEDTLVASGAESVEPIKVADGEEPDNVIRNVLDSLQQRNEAQESLDKSGKKSSKKSKKRSLNVVEAQVSSVEVNNAAQEVTSAINNPKDTNASVAAARKDTESVASHLKNRIEVTINTEDNKQIPKEKANLGDQVSGGAKSKTEKKSSKKPKERNGRVEPASSGASHLQSRVKNDGRVSKVVTKRKEVVKKNSNPVIVENKKTNFFKDADSSSSTEVESKTSDVFSKTPLNSSSSDEDSDVTSMSRKQGNNLPGGTNRFSGSLEELLRSSRSYKKAKLTASQSQLDDEIGALDCVPDSQAI